MVAEFEGCELEAYKDVGRGVWTVGYGCTGEGIGRGTKWTQEQADEELKKRLGVCIREACMLSPCLKTQPERRLIAIADFIYNIGARSYARGGHGGKESHLKAYVDAQLWEHAAMEVLKWNKANGKVLPGLTKRRLKEAELLR